MNVEKGFEFCAGMEGHKPNAICKSNSVPAKTSKCSHQKKKNKKKTKIFPKSDSPFLTWPKVKPLATENMRKCGKCRCIKGMVEKYVLQS